MITMTLVDGTTVCMVIPAIMINALCVQMKAEKGTLNLKSRRFERLQGVKLADMISDRAILAAVNQELNQIAK